MPDGLSLGGGVQPPEGGETAAAFTEGTGDGLVPLLDAAFGAGRYLRRQENTGGAA